MNRTRSLPVALVALLALVVGTLSFAGTSYAAGLTVNQVKFIAGQVVKAKAKNLKVKKAKTATNAKKLGGLPPSAYKTTAYKYLLPTQPTLGNRNYTFPGLPAGTYAVSYSFTANTSGAGVLVACSFGNIGGGLIAAPSYSVGQGSFARGSSASTLTSTATTFLTCGTFGGTFSMNAFNDNVVTFIKLDTTAGGPATGVRGTATRPAAGS